MSIVQPTPPLARGEEMRNKILDATIDSLIDVGYARSSTWEICKRAEISRGAFLHHFPTRIKLFSAAITRLAQGPLDQLDAGLAVRTGTEAVSLFLEWLWKTLDGPLFAVGLELLAAARTEPELQSVLRAGGDQLAAKLDEIARSIAKSAGGDNHAALETMLLMSIPMVRGVGLDLAVGGKRAEHAARFRDWEATVLRATA
jgi:AcrR family transcriptional regulator